MKLKKTASIMIVASILLATFAVAPAFAGTAGECKVIDPKDGDSDFIFNTNTAGIGTTFKVQLWFYPTGTQNVKGWQALLSWDTNLLDCIGEALPAGHIFDNPAYTVQHPSAVIDEGAGTIFAMAILVSPASIDVSEPKVLTEITFNITKTATKIEPLLSCNFTFLKINIAGGTYIINEGGQKLDVNYFGGHYELSWVAPTVYPWLEVAPPTHKVTATYVGQILEVPIYIHDCAAGWEQIGIQFELWYNATLISFVGTGADPEYEKGTFMEGFIGDGLGIFYVVKADFEGVTPIPPGAPIGENYFKVMILKLPNSEGKWNPPFPNGEGLLIKLKIESLKQGLFPTKYTCALEIRNVKFIDRYGNEIDQGQHVSGTYEIEPKVLGRKVDVFTQYPDPYGGQGLNKPSDMFWPQKEVILYANVTYNEWPEQQKDVAFQVIDPHGETWTVLYGRTNETGIAQVSFRLPWPCNNPEYYFGEWTVIATVDVACNVVNDTLWFKYDYLINIWSITVDKDPAQYKHCEYINATVSLGSYAMQKYNVTITMTAFDETGVPFGFVYITIEIGDAVYCQYRNYSVLLSVHVVKFARAGKATLHVGALSDFPFNGGCALCPPEDVNVQILAEWA